MSAPVIREFTIGEIAANPLIFDSYRDPSGYTASHRGSELSLIRDNPAARPNDLTLILAIDENTIIGRLGLYAGRALYGGRDERIQWLSGFFMDPAYRTQGVGGWLFLPALAQKEALLACGGPSKELQAVYTRAGFKALGPLKRFVYFLSARVLVEKFIQGPASRLISACGQPFLDAYYFARRGSGAHRFEYRRVESFGDDYDRMLAAERRNYFPRSSAVLNWVLAHRHLSAFEIRRGGRCEGFILLRIASTLAGGVHNLPSMKIGTLLDYYVIGNDPELERDLILFGLRFFRAAGADVFECQICDPVMETAARHFGLIHIGGSRIFFRPAPGQQASASADWWLTLATSDVILESGEPLRPGPRHR